MILTFLPNPALDKTVMIHGFALGSIYRPAHISTLAGGKGFNFARALRTLGEDALVVAPLAGLGGQRLRSLASEEGLPLDGVAISGELRTCLSIVDPTGERAPTEIYEQGAPLTAEEWKSLVARAVDHFADTRFLAVCGSLPPGTPDHGLRDLVNEANERHLPVLLDTAGPQTLDALTRAPALLKINAHEAATLLHRENAADEAIDLALELQERGAREVVITLGQAGAVGVTSAGDRFGWTAPRVDAISAVGSGDSAFAGIAAGRVRGQPLPVATRLGMAAGAANTLSVGAGRFEREQVERLLSQIEPLAV